MPLRRVLSFKYAFEGILVALRDEPNLKFHFVATLAVVILGWFFQISSSEWLVVILTIGAVLAVELTNTAIEEVVDSFTQNQHPSAKKAKDISAGAVLVVSIAAAIIGIYIFLPYLIQPYLYLQNK